MDSENGHGCTQNAENWLLEQYHKDGNEFLYHIIKGNEIWLSFVNVETNQQSKQWTHTFTKQAEKSAVSKKDDGNCFLRWNSCNMGPQYHQKCIPNHYKKTP
jgi:hypothetical protein